jgi:hypothetical protein
MSLKNKDLDDRLPLLLAAFFSIWLRVQPEANFINPSQYISTHKLTYQ